MPFFFAKRPISTSTRSHSQPSAPHCSSTSLQTITSPPSIWLRCVTDLVKLPVFAKTLRLIVHRRPWSLEWSHVGSCKRGPDRRNENVNYPSRISADRLAGSQAVSRRSGEAEKVYVSTNFNPISLEKAGFFFTSFLLLQGAKKPLA